MVVDLKDKNRIIYFLDYQNKKVKARVLFSYEDFVYVEIKNEIFITKLDKKSGELVEIEEEKDYKIALKVLKQFFEENKVQDGEYDILVDGLDDVDTDQNDDYETDEE